MQCEANAHIHKMRLERVASEDPPYFFLHSAIRFCQLTQLKRMRWAGAGQAHGRKVWLRFRKEIAVRKIAEKGLHSWEALCEGKRNQSPER